MIEFVIAYDEKDEELGTYFQKCRDKLLALVAGITDFSHASHDVPSDRCNRQYLDIALERLKEIPFVITAYMHGKETQLTVNGGRFIDVDDDNTFFRGAFFYTNSCSSGKVLGPKLIDQQCEVFIGFDQDVVVLRGDHENLSIDCDNCGIYAFLLQDITAFEAYEQMRRYYLQKIDELRKVGDILTAGVLMATRESLVFHGNRELKKAHLVSPICHDKEIEGVS